MTVYAPVSGVTKDDLFDWICNNIDSTISGNPTGWTIIADSRDSGRVTAPGNIASGYKPVVRKSKVPVLVKESPGVNKYIQVQRVIQHPVTGVYYMWMHVINEVVGARFASSSDGVNFGSIFTLTVSSTQTYPSVGQDLRPYNDVGGMAFPMMFKPSTGTNINVGYTTSLDTLATASTTFAAGGTPGTSLFHTWCVDFNANQWYHFWPLSGYATLRYALMGHATSPSPTNYSLSPANGNFLTATGIGVDLVLGVAGIEPFGDEYNVYVTVEHLSTIKTILCRTVGAASVPSNPLSVTKVVVSYDDITQGKLVTPGATLYSSTGLTLPGENSISKWYSSEYPPAPNDDRYHVSAFSLAGEVDGIPDLNGLQYEYVVFESSHTANNGDGYYLVLLQLNPNQGSPPAIANLSDPTTGTFPIFARLTRNWNTVTDSPTRFFFDPVIPTAIDPDADDMYGPCLLTVPNPGGPVDTHKIWLKASPRQVFFFTETSASSKYQYVHVNIAEPLTPLEETPDTNLRNDNVFACSSGSALGAGAIYLGRNGQSEAAALDVRNNGDVFYPLGATITYSSILTTQNTVDGYSYAFPVYAASDVSSLDVAPVVDLSYSSGKLYETLFYTNTGSLVNGDTVNVGADTYFYFSTSANTGSHFDGIVTEKVLIKWV